MVKNAIILAAGYGSRLQSRSASKPLAMVHGLSLIEIAVRQAAAAGAREIIVVTGHRASEVETALPQISLPSGCRVSARRLDDWSKPNGWSVIAGALSLSGPFLLMMADHIFGDAILPLLAAQELTGTDVVLATDRTDNPLIDPDDVTWVKLNECGRIREIGKDISGYNAADCGAFLANAALPAAIEQAIRSGKPGSLSDGMQVLADADRATAMDIGGAWWIDVDDPRAHDLAGAQAADNLAIFGAERRATIDA